MDGLATAPGLVVFAGSLGFALVVLAGINLAGRRVSAAAGAGALTVGVAAWFMVVTLLGLAGVFAASTAVRAPLVGVTVLLAVAYALGVLPRLPGGRTVIAAVPPAWLIGLHTFRVGFGAAFLLAMARGELSPEWAWPVGLGDIAAGALAVPVAWLVATQRTGWHLAALGWNVFGLIDILHAVALGNLSQPGPFQLLVIEPGVPIGSFPFTLLPTFVVPIIIATHLYLIVRLLRRPVEVARPA